MAQEAQRTNFRSSGFIRFLDELSVADVADSRQSFADRLGQWLDFKDAISLFSVINDRAPDAQTGAPLRASLSVHEEFARVRAMLADSIRIDGVLNPGKARIKLPAPSLHPTNEDAADFLPFQRYYLAHQRDMNAHIGPLRASVRNALADHSPALKRLAALDGVLDQALGPRERNLLATVPQLLAKRFEHLHQAHKTARVDTATPDDPEAWLQPGGWLAAFCKDMQAVLLAELDVRLHPVAGLIDALGNQDSNQQ